MGCQGGCGEKNEYPSNISEDVIAKTEAHPCYSANAHKYARMHIPIAPKCNIQCNYCNRKYDCVNETRPGVTSELLNPMEAAEKYLYVKSQIENLKVVGIAGPGDALANWEETKESVRLLKEKDPFVTICLSTNGLMLDKYKEELVEMGIHHITITINSIDPSIGAKIYEFVNYEGVIYTGIEAAEILMSNQMIGLKYLAEHGVLCKVNMVLIKGVNDHHIPLVVKKVKELGAFVSNIMPLIPAEGTRFEDKPMVSKKELNELRKKCEIDMKQMYHCQQCRADAIGQLTQDRSLEFKGYSKEEKKEYTFAVASKEGKVIDQHFGHVTAFYIYKYKKGEITLSEKREVEKYCSGVEDCDSKGTKMDKLFTALDGCDAILSVRIGYSPKQRLKKGGILSIEIYDEIEEGIKKAVRKLA